MLNPNLAMHIEKPKKLGFTINTNRPFDCILANNLSSVCKIPTPSPLPKNKNLWRAAHLCGQLPVLFINETSSNIVDTFVPCDPKFRLVSPVIRGSVGC
jgi:hypothetical protein